MSILGHFVSCSPVYFREHLFLFSRTFIFIFQSSYLYFREHLFIFSRTFIYIFESSYIYFRKQLFIFLRAIIFIFESSYFYFRAAIFSTFLKQLFDFRKPSSSTAAAASDARSLHLIRCYFSLGLNYDEIIASLASNYNIFISKANLNRKLRELCLYRRKQISLMLHVLQKGS